MKKTQPGEKRAIAAGLPVEIGTGICYSGIIK
jgi:hypothetical protein